MMSPTVHLNGTSYEALYQQQLDVSTKARALLDALREASPNARDYYPQGPDAFKRACDEHSQLVDGVVQVLGVTYAQLEALAEGRS